MLIIYSNRQKFINYSYKVYFMTLENNCDKSYEATRNKALNLKRPPIDCESQKEVCNNGCCRHTTIFLHPEELKLFTEEFIDKVGDKYLYRHPKKCEHLSNNGCAIYDKRPVACVYFSCFEQDHPELYWDNNPSLFDRISTSAKLFAYEFLTRFNRLL